MKVLIVSDTHGREENLEKAIAQNAPLDYVIHLGDSESGETRIRALTDCPVYMVAGNCDFFTSLPTTAVITIGGHRILITHGHYYYVSVGVRDLVEEAKANNCDIAMFGHTHRPLLDQSDPDVTVVNPGSLSFPRQPDRRPSYMIMTIEEGCPPKYRLDYIN
jgi:hypothetical protein